jgi:chromosome segregation ATPase
MPSVGVYDQIKRAFQDLVAPEIHSLRGDIRVIDERLIALDQKLTSTKAELLAEIRRVDTRIDGVDSRIDGLDQQLRVAIDIRERLAALEARRPS